MTYLYLKCFRVLWVYLTEWVKYHIVSLFYKGDNVVYFPLLEKMFIENGSTLQGKNYFHKGGKTILTEPV